MDSIVAVIKRSMGILLLIYIFFCSPAQSLPVGNKQTTFVWNDPQKLSAGNAILLLLLLESLFIHTNSADRQITSET